MQNKFFGILFLLVVALVGCKDGDVLPNSIINQLEHQGAVMPVHIYGNNNSETAIIIVHGGPGESAILKRDAVGLNRLEEEHLVVYYDQRGAGVSEGNVDPNSITINQLSEDLNAVIELVDEITNAEKIFLVSLDWGGAIAATYLTSTNYNDKVKGYIASNPGFNAARTMNASLDTLQIVVNDLEANSPGSGVVLQDYLFQTFNINQFNYEAHYRVVDGLLGIEFFQNYTTASVDLPGFSKRQVEQNLLFSQQNLQANNGPFLDSLNVEPLLSQIPVPTKIIWGTHDLLFPVQLAESYQNQLGDVSSNEQISYFRVSAHRPYYEEGDRFYAVVSTWVSLF